MELLDHLPEIFPHPFYIKDESGKFILTNDAFAQLYNTSAAALVNQSLTFDFAAERDSQIIKNGQFSVFEECFKLTNGKKIWFSTLKKPIRLSDGNYFLLSVSANITQYKNPDQQENGHAVALGLLTPEIYLNLKETIAAIQHLALQLAKDLTDANQKKKIEEIISLVGNISFTPKVSFFNEQKPDNNSSGSAFRTNDSTNPIKNSATVKSISVLLAEDNEINLELTTAQIKAHGIMVESAANGAEALRKAKEKPFDLILMDIQMPELDGIAATKLIRKEENPNRNTPIIAFTANIYNLSAEEYKKIGFSDFLPKPYAESNLMHIISHYTSFNLTPASAENRLFDFSGLGDLGRDAGFIRKMQRLFIQTVPAQLNEIKEAVSQGNWDLVAANAHKLKSTYGNIKVNGPAAAMKEIEALALEKKDLHLIPNLLKETEETTTQVVDAFAGHLQNLS